MPGRGQYWKRGGLNDDTVIGADIEAGSIELSDLDASTQALITGGGGGAWTQIASSTVSAPTNTVTIPIAPTINFDGTCAKIVLCGTFQTDVDDTILYRMSGFTGPSDYQTKGVTTGATPTGINQSASGWKSNLGSGNTAQNFFWLELSGLRFGFDGPLGFLKDVATGNQLANGGSYCTLSNGTDIGALTEFSIATENAIALFQNGSKFVVLKQN